MADQAQAYGDLIYQVGADDFGQTLKPHGPTPLTPLEKLALAVREASAVALYPGHAPNPDLTNLNKALWAPSPEPGPDPLPTIKTIAALAFDDLTQKKTFIDHALLTLTLIDSQKP
jgi:hypothetical protein